MASIDDKIFRSLAAQISQRFPVKIISTEPVREKGSILYNSTDDNLYYSDGFSWIQMTDVIVSPSRLALQQGAGEILTNPIGTGFVANAWEDIAVDSLLISWPVIESVDFTDLGAGSVPIAVDTGAGPVLNGNTARGYQADVAGTYEFSLNITASPPTGGALDVPVGSFGRSDFVIVVNGVVLQLSGFFSPVSDSTRLDMFSLFGGGSSPSVTTASMTGTFVLSEGDNIAILKRGRTITGGLPTRPVFQAATFSIRRIA